MDHPRNTDGRDLRGVRDLLGQTLADDPRRRADAVRALSVALGRQAVAATEAAVPVDPSVAARTQVEGWDRVLELVDDPDRTVRRTVLHVLAVDAPADRADDVARALRHLAGDDDLSLRARARKVSGRFQRDRSAA